MAHTPLSILQQVCADLGYAFPEGVVMSEPPAQINADFSTNIALQLSRELKKNPRELAEEIKEKLQNSDGIMTVDSAGPGFLNISIADHWYKHMLEGTLSAVTPAATPKAINVEYVSANPSGPLHIGNARGGPVGETVARVLEAQGHQVAREFYLNDIGGQATTFAASVLHHYLVHFGQPSTFPEGGYPAPYVKELAEEIAASAGDQFVHLSGEDQVEAMRKVAITRQVAKIFETTDRMGIRFDKVYPQSELEDSGLSNQVLEELKERGMTLEKDGALWLKSGIQEDDRETVLVKSDGNFGYFLDDIAYHHDKLVIRNFDTAVVLLGANHSGHTPRMRAGIQAIGLDSDRYQSVLYQYVQVKEGNETRRMAKREGTFVTANEVLDEVPVEVFTFFMLSKANETHLDFDLQLAKDTSEKNPIYYIQYAHARICSVLSRAQEQGVQAGDELAENYQYGREERELLRHLARFDEIVQEVATSFRTHLIPNYLHEVATRYHHFYAHQRIITDNPEETTVRLRLSRQTVNVLRQGLHLLNIPPLDKM